MAWLSVALTPISEPDAAEAVANAESPDAGRLRAAETVKFAAVTWTPVPVEALTFGEIDAVAIETPTVRTPPLIPSASAVACGALDALTVTEPVELTVEELSRRELVEPLTRAVGTDPLPAAMPPAPEIVWAYAES